MIAASAPLRLSLGGGGSDLPGFADRFGGFVVAAAIRARVGVVVRQRPGPDVRIRWAEEDRVSSARDVRHPLVREALASTGTEGGVEIESSSPLPAGSGLGSSSSFTVALLCALRRRRGEAPTARALADEAAAIEIERLEAPIGRQDQLAAAHGGVCAMTFEPGGRATVERMELPPGTTERLAASLVLVHTGLVRAARDPLLAQRRALARDPGALEAMRRIAEVGRDVAELLRRGDVDAFGDVLREHWERKRRTAPAMSSPAIDALVELGRGAGARGGKLTGAGGGGFVLFQVPPSARPRFDATLRARGHAVVDVALDAEGARIDASPGPGRTPP